MSLQPRVSILLDRSIAGALLAVIVFTTLAHGAVEPWSAAIFELIVIALLLLWGIKASLDRRLDLTLPGAVAPIAALLLLGVAQNLAAISTDPEATRHAVTILFFLTVSFVAASNFFRSRERLMLLANALTVFGAVVSAFALIQDFTWNGRLYWVRSTDYPAFGPFVNRNHFAGYMAMLAPLPLGLILTVVRGQARLVYGLAASLMGTAAFASGSRSGVISLSAGVVFVAILHRRSRADASWPVRRRKINPFVVVASATIACVLWIGPARTVERFAEAVDALVRTGAPDVRRATIWRETLGMIRDYPILGAGLGSYETIQPAYASTPSLFTVDYAHNDYLQVLAEGGAIAGILALCFLVVTFSAVYRGLRSRDPLFAGLSLAAGAGILAVAVQSVSDTDLQIPSNAVLFLTLSAIVSNIGERRQTQDFGPLLPLSKRFRVFEVNR